jgi:hypothetical protein
MGLFGAAENVPEECFRQTCNNLTIWHTIIKDDYVLIKKASSLLRVVTITYTFAAES